MKLGIRGAVWLGIIIGCALGVFGDVYTDYLAYYSFDGDAYDASANAYHGTIHGAVLSNEGINCSSYYFDGVDDYIEVTNAPLLEIGTNDFTISLWLKTTRSESASARIFQTGGWGPSIGYSLHMSGYQYDPEDDGEIGAEVASTTTGSGINSTNGPINDGLWHHVLMAADRDDQCILYVDGEVYASGDITADSGSLSNEPCRVVIGGSSSSCYEGLLDEIRVYDRLLTPEEMLLLYTNESICVTNHLISASGNTGGQIEPCGSVIVDHGGSQTFTIGAESGYHLADVLVDGVSIGATNSYTFIAVVSNHSIQVQTIQENSLTNGLIGYWPLDGDAEDYSVYHHEGILSGATFIGEGIHCASLYFDGEDDYFQVTNNSVLEMGTNDFTISLWLKTDRSGSSSMRLVQTGGWGPSIGYSLHMRGYQYNVQDDGKIGAEVASTAVGSGIETTNAPKNDGLWHHVVFTANRDSVGTIYVDGDIYAFSDISDDSGTLSNEPMSFVIGGSPSGTSCYEGYLDEVRIYSRLLTSDEISRLYTNVAICQSNLTITATAATGGNIAPSGSVSVPPGSNQTFSITSQPGYAVTNVLVDAVSVGITNSYTFYAVATGHTIHVQVAGVVDLTNSLIGHWTFDGDALDVSGYNHHGYLSGATYIQEGVNCGAYDFDGIDDYVVITNCPLLEIGTNDFSVSLWYKTTRSGPGGLRMVQTGGWGPSIGYSLHLCGDGSDGELGAEVASTSWGSGVDSDEGPRNDGMWHHAVFVADRDGMGTIYMDGEVYAIDSISADSGSLYNEPEQLVIGGSPSGSSCFEGSLDEVRIYRRAINEEEVMALYTNVTLCYSNFVVQAGADKGGRIHPYGKVMVQGGSNQSFTISADAGYRVGDVIVDSVSVGVTNTYTFVSIDTNHSIYVITSGNVNLTNSLIGHWTFDGDARDVSGYNHHGYLSGATYIQEGVNCGAYDFDGIDDYVVITNCPLLEIGTNDFSVSLWFKTTRSGPGGLRMVQTGGWGPSIGYSLHLCGDGSDGELGAEVASTSWGSGVDSDEGPRNDGMWHHAVFVADRDGMGTIYMDGEVYAIDSISADSGSLYNEPEQLVIGGSPSGSSCFEGSLDEVRIYNRALSEEEVLDLFTNVTLCGSYVITAAADVGGRISPNGKVGVLSGSNQTFTITLDPGYDIDDVIVDGASIGATNCYTFTAVDSNHTIYVDFSGTPQLTNSLIGYWPFDGDVLDYSGYGHDGTLSGALYINEGLNCGSYYFDGVNDYVQVTDAPLLEIGTNDFTISLWLKTDRSGSSSMRLVQTGGWGPSIGYSLHMRGYQYDAGDDGEIGAEVASRSTGSGINSTNGPRNDNTWHHVVLAADRDGLGIIYVDGSVYASQDISPDSGSLSNEPINLVIGGSPNGSSCYRGFLDEVRIYNRLLNQEEIASLYTDVTFCVDHTIIATANVWGALEPSGESVVETGSNKQYSAVAEPSAYLASLIVDNGMPIPFEMGTTSAVYIFSNVVQSHTIEAIFNVPPVLHVNVRPLSGTVPLPVQYDFSASFDTNDNVMNCRVDMNGNGVVDAEIDGLGALTATYMQPGIYTSAMQVVDGYGAFDQTSIVIQVSGAAPVADLVASPFPGGAPCVVILDASGSAVGDGKTIRLYEWDCNGDGVYEKISSNAVIEYIYREAGTYLPEVRITDTEGLQDSARASVDISLPYYEAPVVHIIANTNRGYVPLPVELTAVVTNVEDVIVSYEWDFEGDGRMDVIQTNEQVSFTYEQVGMYHPSVLVTSDKDLSGRATTDVSVTINPKQYRIWISKPKSNKSIWGDSISIIGHIAPANETLSVAFEYREHAETNWTQIGAPVYPQPRAYKQTWDVSALEESDYVLRARADVGGGRTIVSENVLLNISSSGHVKEYTSGGNHTLEEDVEGNETTTSQLSDGTKIVIPAGALESDTLVIEITGTNSLFLNGIMSEYAGIDAGRRVSFTGASKFSRPITLIIPYRDEDNDGFVDGRGIPEKSLNIQWLDKESGEWIKTISTVVDEENNVVKATIYHMTEFGVFGYANVLYPGNGGILDSYESEFGPDAAAHKLTDGSTTNFWRSQIGPTNEVFAYRFSNYMGAVMHTIMLNNYGEEDVGQNRYSKDIEVQVSMDGMSYESVLSETLDAEEGIQEFDVGSVTGRYVRLLVESGTDAEAWELAEFSALGALTDDADRDGMTDEWEMINFGDFDEVGDADNDGDGLVNSEECLANTCPTNCDTDGDSMDDGWEAVNGLDPLEDDTKSDRDQDGLNNIGEYIAGTDPTNALSYFAVTNYALEGNQIIFRWPAFTNREYIVDVGTNLPKSGFIGIYTNTYPGSAYTSSLDGECLLFRIRVRKLD